MDTKLNHNPTYKVDYVDPKLYKNKWGTTDFYEAKLLMESLLNSNAAKNYKLVKVIDEMKDGLSQPVPMFIFEQKGN